MSFNPNARLDPSQVSDQRGRGGGTLIVGGGLGLVILVASLLLGFDPSSILDATTSSAVVENGPSAQDCRTGADANQREDCRIVGFVDSIQRYWSDEFERRGQTYDDATTVLYTSVITAGCGTASAAMGPFYCPADGRVYLDLAFFDELHSRFGAKGGPFAEAYVVAHEYGHHVQELLGLLEPGTRTGPTSASVRTELQADCLAGVWMKHASETGFLQAPTDTDLAAALDAAAAVGDDRIQRETQGRVAPEAWTHGSSQQRQQWLRTGFTTGDLASCSP